MKVSLSTMGLSQLSWILLPKADSRENEEQKHNHSLSDPNFSFSV
jgi:hypothetical protein